MSSSPNIQRESNKSDQRVKIDERSPLIPETNVGLGIRLNDIIEIKTFSDREAIYLLKKAFPALFAFLFLQALQVTNVFFVGHLGQAELAGLALGTMYAAVTCWSIGFGATSALDTLCPQGYTSGNPKMAGIYTQRAIIIMMIGFIPIGIIWLVSENILIGLGQDAELSHYAALYLRYLLLGAPPALIFWCLEKFLQGQGIMKATTYVLVICCPINIFLNYIFIWEPFSLGFIGAPIATTLTNWLMLFLTFLYIQHIDGYDAWGGWTHLSFKDWSSFTKLALPGMLTSCADWWIYELIALFAGYFGSISLASHRLILTIALILYQIPHSLAVAASNRVGNLLGAGLPNRASIATNTSLLLAVIGAACNAMVLLYFRESLGYFFTHDEDVVKMVASILPLAAIFQFSDSVGNIGSGVLRGQGRLKMVAAIFLPAFYLIGLPLGLMFAFEFNMGLKGLWSGVTCASISMAIGIFLAVSMTDWRWEVEECHRRVKNELIDDIDDDL
ncbi:4914_t:CDS:2 [Cetraspora pellucida]|uniref:4914_t:CDS:1 n=2 Tax=Cetraspora pellucida TaxID=1433469 RepID=A0ACA9M1D5_9GLOM|nr:4913_t:CDS:2 [Cetraspora pellucida]CAG8561487.1 4914_t:CDS:2 [Cetraspora pellucida]